MVIHSVLIWLCGNSSPNITLNVFFSLPLYVYRVNWMSYYLMYISSKFTATDFYVTVYIIFIINTYLMFIINCTSNVMYSTQTQTYCIIYTHFIWKWLMMIKMKSNIGATKSVTIFSKLKDLLPVARYFSIWFFIKHDKHTSLLVSSEISSLWIEGQNINGKWQLTKTVSFASFFFLMCARKCTVYHLSKTKFFKNMCRNKIYNFLKGNKNV